MTVTLRLCKRHGGTRKRGRPPLNCRCVLCDLERRALQQRMEVVGVPYELQVDVGLPGYPDYATLETYDEKDRAERDMHDLLSKFRTAKMRVINIVVNGASDGVQAAN